MVSAMTFVPHKPGIRSKPKGKPRRIVKTSLFYFNRSQALWQIVILSLPLEPLCAAVFDEYGTLPRIEDPAGVLSTLQALLLLLAALGLRLPALMPYIERAREQNFFKGSALLHYGALIGYGAAFLSLFRAAASSTQVAGASIVAGLVVAALIFKQVTKIRARLAIQQQTFSTDLATKVEHFNQHHFLAAIVPLLLARVSITLGALIYFCVQDSSTHYLLMTGAAAGLLFLLAPDRSVFVARCPRCAVETSRVVTTLGFCPACSPEQFITKDR